MKEVQVVTLEHRNQTLASNAEYRAIMSTKIANYFARSMDVIESNVNMISASDSSLRTALASEPSTACIANLQTVIDLTLENAGYQISNCISDVDGISSTAFKSFQAILDVHERNFNLEPSILNNALFGRNIFTQSKPIITRAKNLLNAKVTLFAENLKEITDKLNEVSLVYDDQIAILDQCLKTTDTEVESAVASISNLLSTCHNFNKA